MATHVTDHGAIGRRGAESGRLALGLTPGVASAYARYIGRVGALAVALGIGVVVVTGNGLGVAHAQDGADATDSQTTDAPSTTETTVDPSSDPTEPGPSANQGPPESGQTLENPSVPEMKQNSSGGLIESADAAKDGDEDPESVVKDDADADPPVDAAADQPPSAPVDPPQPQIVPAAAVNVPQVGGSTTPAGKDADLTKGSTGGNTLEVSELDETSVDTVQLGSPQAAFGRLALFSEQDPADFAVNGPQLKITTAQANVGVAPVRSPQQGLLALPVALLNFAITVVNTVLTQFVGGGPTPPAQPPLLFALLAFVRNELQRSFGPAPVADAITTSENTQTTFTAAELLDNDTDIPGEVLKITDWSAPAHGIVRRNTDGTFTYTPNANFSGTDTFTYTMSDEDNPFHIHLFAKSYEEPGHTATATVTVTVTEVPQGTVLSDTTVTGTDGVEYELTGWEKGGESGGQTDANGNLYMLVGGEVHIYKPDNTLKSTGKLPVYTSPSGHGQEWVDVAPLPNGDIYAVDYRYQIFDDGGKPESTTVKKLKLGPDGNYTVDNSFTLEKFPYGADAQGPILRTPQGYRIATDDAGNLYVAQGFFVPEHQTFNTVIKYDTDGKYVTRFGEEVTGNLNQAISWEQGRFKVLAGIAVTGDGSSVFTTETTNGRVQRWDRNDVTGQYTSKAMWGNSFADDPDRNPDTGVRPDLLAPFDIGLDDDGNVYVLSTTESKIVKYDRDGHKIVQMFMGDNNTPDTFTPNVRSHGIAVTAAGDAISIENGRMMHLVP